MGEPVACVWNGEDDPCPEASVAAVGPLRRRLCRPHALRAYEREPTEWDSAARMGEQVSELLRLHSGPGWETLSEAELVAMVHITDGVGRTPDIKGLLKRMARELLELRAGPACGTCGGSGNCQRCDGRSGDCPACVNGWCPDCRRGM